MDDPLNDGQEHKICVGDKAQRLTHRGDQVIGEITDLSRMGHRGSERDRTIAKIAFPNKESYQIPVSMLVPCGPGSWIFVEQED